MKPKKEHYRRKLPHYQQPGQWYSVTFSLAGAMPKGAMHKYSVQLETARTRMEELRSRESEFPGIGISKSDANLRLGKSKSQSSVWESRSPGGELAQAKKEYQIALLKYRLAYDKFLNNSTLPGINLLKDGNRKIIEEALLFWEGKRLTNHAWCIMSNHVHWIITVFEKQKGVVVPNSDKEKPVYLQDLLHSVKLFTARRINENEHRSGQLWEAESFDTTIRNDRHFVNVFNYVIQNPVSAGLVQNWEDWAGSRTFQSPTFPS